MYVGTAWCMSEQPDIYRYSLMYVGTAWHMSFRSVLKISGRVCTHMVYMILALNKTFQILIISAWLQLLFNIYCTIFMKCYSCIPVYLYICHQHMSGCSDIHQAVPIYMSGCSDMHQAVPTYMRLFRYTSGCSDIHQAVPIYVRLFQNTSGCSDIHEVVPIYVRLFRHTSGCSDMQQAVPTYVRLFRHTSGCSDIRKAVPTCTRLFRLSQTLKKKGGMHHVFRNCYMYCFQGKIFEVQAPKRHLKEFS
jgi:hypothetical protein